MNFQYYLTQPYVNFSSQPIYFSIPAPQISFTYHMTPTTQTYVQELQSAPSQRYRQSENLPQLQMDQNLSPERPEHNLLAGGPRVRVPRKRIPEKELESAKKNSESNIINQMLSFFNESQKCERVVQRIVFKLGRSPAESEKIEAIFYNIIRLINFRRGRKYVNRIIIKGYFTEEEITRSIPDIESKLSEVNILSLPQLTKILRIAFTFFVKSTSINAILTSKRVSVVAKIQHLRRRRRVKACFTS